MMAGIFDLVERNPNPGDRIQLETTLGHIRDLTRIMETEIHETVLSCSRARRQMLDGIITPRSPVH